MAEIITASRRLFAITAGTLLMAGTLAFGGATPAHADTDCWNDPAATDTETGDGSCDNTGGSWGGEENSAWPAGRFDFVIDDGGSAAIWTTNDGTVPTQDDARNLARNLGYTGGCFADGTTTQVVCFQ